ncbi:hypothetical protein KUTeg_018192, partial [Tegillarca granosa]
MHEFLSRLKTMIFSKLQSVVETTDISILSFYALSQSECKISLLNVTDFSVKIYVKFIILNNVERLKTELNLQELTNQSNYFNIEKSNDVDSVYLPVRLQFAVPRQCAMIETVTHAAVTLFPPLRTIPGLTGGVDTGYGNVFFCITLIKIKTMPKIQSNAHDRNELSIYLKLFTLTGITWLLQVVDSFFIVSALSYIVVILNGFQGLFIFISYTCNRRVIKLYRERFFKSDYSISSSTHSSSLTRSTHRSTTDNYNTVHINNSGIRPIITLLYTLSTEEHV